MNAANTPASTGQEILDAEGRAIVAGSVVKEKERYYGSQGFVVDPRSTIEGRAHCVAVFFGTEVSGSYFNCGVHTVDCWDAGNRNGLRTSDFAFLLEGDLWKSCPRIVFFKPAELIVEDGWSLSTLVERRFGNRYHSIYELPKGVLPHKASDYQCFRESCTAAATKLALYNVWGSVFPMYVCDNCSSEVDGKCADSLPKLKRPFLTADGKPIIVAKQP